MWLLPPFSKKVIPNFRIIKYLLYLRFHTAAFSVLEQDELRPRKVIAGIDDSNCVLFDHAVFKEKRWYLLSIMLIGRKKNETKRVTNG